MRTRNNLPRSFIFHGSQDFLDKVYIYIDVPNLGFEGRWQMNQGLDKIGFFQNK